MHIYIAHIHTYTHTHILLDTHSSFFPPPEHLFIVVIMYVPVIHRYARALGDFRTLGNSFWRAKFGIVC